MIAGRYEILRPLGHGGMAVVDLARDAELERDVALKRLAENFARDDELRARFLREARLAARLSHPNVVRIYDVGEDDGAPFIAMEYVDGETLAALCARRGPLPALEAAELGVQICNGLAAVHAAGLVHRDVKPQNLLLRRDGVLKLGDFGIAFGLEATRLTMAGTVLGTAAYRAPEQARGEEVTAAADIYAAGAVLYELLVGHPPSETSTPQRPPALASVVLPCLAADPAARPASAAALARSLARTERPTRVVRRTQRRLKPAIALAAIALVAIVGGLTAALAPRGGAAKPPPVHAARVTPIPHAAQPQQQAQNLAAWLVRYSR